MTQTWIAVADASRARIFLARDHGPLQEIDDLSQPEERLDDADRRHDAKGRFYGAGGREATHTAEPRTEPSDKLEDRLARRLAERLDEGCRSGAYDELIIVSAPSLLGHVRAVLDRQVARRVVCTIDKDLAGLDGRAIEARLRADGALH